MKKIYLIVFVILMAWNIALTMSVVNINNNSNKNNENTTNIKQLSTEFETDYSDVIDLVKERVVGVNSLPNNRISNGVVYGKSEDGGLLVVTRATSLVNAESITVLFANNEKVEAELIGSDIFSDIALIKINPEFNVEAFTLGDSSVVNEGEYVLSISSRANDDFYGFYSSCMISGKNRIVRKDIDGNGVNDYDLPLIQIDDSLDANSAGAALVNMNGELIGIINSTVSTSANEAVAVSINEVKLIVNSILNGEVNRVIQPVFVKDIKSIPMYLRSYYNVPFDIEDGVVVLTINDESYGFALGDVIEKVDNVDIKSNDMYRSYLYNSSETNHTYTVNRNNEKLTISVEIKEND